VKIHELSELLADFNSEHIHTTESSSESGKVDSYYLENLERQFNELVQKMVTKYLTLRN
jgi:hypothetical protein